MSAATFALPRPLPVSYARRSAALLAGLAVIGAGDAMVVAARLGGSPFSSLIVRLAERTGMSIGTMVITIGLFLVAVAGVVTRRLPGKVAFAAPFVAGIAENAALPVMRASTVSPWLLGLTGLVVIGLGVGVYLGAGLGRAAVESLLTTLSEKTGWKVRTTMVLWHGTCLLLALAVGGHVGPLTVAFPLILPALSSQVMRRSPFVEFV